MAEPWINKKGWLKGFIPEKPSVIPEEVVKEAKQDKVAPIPYGVVFYPIKCPKCHSKDTKCYHSNPPVRYHRCNKCKYRFKSREASEKEISAAKVVATT